MPRGCGLSHLYSQLEGHARVFVGRALSVSKHLQFSLGSPAWLPHLPQSKHCRNGGCLVRGVAGGETGWAGNRNGWVSSAHLQFSNELLHLLWLTDQRPSSH